MRRLSGILIAALILLSSVTASAQMTRSQLLKKYYQVTQLHNSGKDAEAIAVCEEIAAVYPKLPDTYLRMAQIYDDGGESELALVMYRTYESLEMDDRKVAEHRQRISQLEEKVGAQKLEEQEQEAFEKLMAETAKKETAKKENAANDTPVAFTSSATSLFDLSALVASANTREPEPEPEPESEPEPELFDMPQLQSQPIAIMKTDIKSEPIPEPEINVEVVQETEKIFEEARTSASKADCDSPFLFSAHPKAIDELHIDRSADFSHKVTPKRKFETRDDLVGKWVSSAINSETGRDFIILDIDQMGSNLSAMINEESGLFLDKKNNLLKSSWNAVKSIWSSDGADFDATELIGTAVRGNFSEDSFDFTFSLKKKDKPNVANIGREVMDGLSMIIPFGALASRIGSTLLNYAGRKMGNENFQTTINFSIKSVTEDVLSCSYIVSERHNTSDGTRDMVIEERSFHMFRVPASYQPYSYTSNIQDNALYRAMYAKLEQESQTDPSKLFPLAYMSYFGAGTGSRADETDRMSMAVVQMQKLADTGCLRASAWLVPVYYNLSIDEKHYPMRIQRKRFRELSDQQLSNLLLGGNPYVYGLNGDILTSGNSDPDEIAAEYEKGASKNDPYSLFCLGKAYKDGVVKSRDLDASLDCFRKSAAAGYADAYWQIALAYKSGLGVTSDYGQYISYLFKAIDAGSIEAMQELSIAYFWGIGVEHDVDMALQTRRSYFNLKNNVWRDVLAQYGFPDM